MSPAERTRRYREKKWAEWANGPQIKCACGCGTLIPATNKLGRPAKFAHGHNSTPDHLRRLIAAGYNSPGGAAYEAKRANGTLSLSGERSPRWKGGEWLISSGYVRVTLTPEEAAQHPTALAHGGGWSIPRTHLVWNHHYPNDRVQPGDHIHHRNRIRDDDRIENLEKLDGKEHVSMHARAEPQPKDPITGRFVPR